MGEELKLLHSFYQRYLGGLLVLLTQIRRGRARSRWRAGGGQRENNNSGRIRKTSSEFEFETMYPPCPLHSARDCGLLSSQERTELFHQIHALHIICFYSRSCSPRIFGSLKSHHRIKWDKMEMRTSGLW